MVFEFLKFRKNSTDSQDTESSLQSSKSDPRELLEDVKKQAGCFETISESETCKTNEQGEFLCDRIKETWRTCPGEKPVLVAREASQRVPGDASTFIEKINDRPSLFTDSRDEPLSPIAMNRDLFFPHGGFHSDIFRALEEMQRHLFDSFQNDPFFRQHDFFSNNRFPPPPSPSSSNPDGMIPPSDVGGIPRVRDRNPNFVPHHSRQPLPKDFPEPEHWRNDRF